MQRPIISDRELEQPSRNDLPLFAYKTTTSNVITQFRVASSKMLRQILFFLYVLTYAQCQVLPLIFAAPSAVSHQSRIDIKRTPVTPLIYSPSGVFGSNFKEIQPNRRVDTTIYTDAVLTPIALTFFHNLPLARALEHPISLSEVQSKTNQDEEKYIKKSTE
ncbi:unnamed protein product [Leptosia nina]|uniref:Uncharacterized protein n=1 Tax=Leptosia nina TaxID=320188 RepID=A0AAV1K589_9NEOP